MSRAFKNERTVELQKVTLLPLEKPFGANTKAVVGVFIRAARQNPVDLFTCMHLADTCYPATENSWNMEAFVKVVILTIVFLHKGIENKVKLQ